MPESYEALSVAVEEDLLPLTALLHQNGVEHRIFEQGGRQVLMVSREDQARQVRVLYQAWRAGEVQIQLAPGEQALAPSSAGSQWRNAPVTLCLIGLSVCGFLLLYLSAPLSWLSYLTFTPFQVSGEELLFQDADSQYWRLVTPVFLHFGWLHIVFNSLWMWEFGRRVEQVMGHFNMLMLFLVIAIVSNVSQFAFGGEGLFGGMSGVVYGLLGFSWSAPLLHPDWQIRPPNSITVLMVGWLLACMAGMVEVLGFGAIANAAHFGGLLCGLALGVVFGAFARAGSDKTRPPRV